MTEKKKKKRKNPLTPALVVLTVSLLLTIVICFVLVLLVFSTGKGGLSLFNKEEPSEVASEEPVVVTYSQAEVEELLENAREEGANAKETEIKEYIRSEAESNNPSFSTVLRKMYPECVVYSGDGRFYFEPIDENIAPENVHHVLGVQGNLWTEFVNQWWHAEMMLYPRLFAVAETGWSPRMEKDYSRFRTRAVALNKVLDYLGYNHFPLGSEEKDGN